MEALICLHGTNGTAEIFYKQMLHLCPKGYRLISVQYPAYSNHEQWLKAFDKFMDTFKINKVHLFGTALGGYLAQLYTHYRPSRVVSLVLCNSFCDTQYFADTTPLTGIFSFTPEFILKRLLVQKPQNMQLEKQISHSIDFVIQQTETVPQEELASRLALNCTVGPVVALSLKLDQSNITIIDSLDDHTIPDRVKDEVLKLFPEARQAFLKTGGHYPFLSRHEEFNLYLEVHLRRAGYGKLV
uniref:Maspardin n=1 Tax=Arcella intermedia TaxID=1963864 RepID=A0A6B2LD31_9EUKA